MKLEFKVDLSCVNVLFFFKKTEYCLSLFNNIDVRLEATWVEHGCKEKKMTVFMAMAMRWQT